MLIPYFKNNVEQSPIEIPNRVWKGCQSKYVKTQDKNIEIVWTAVRHLHPDNWTIEASFRETKISSWDKR